jgi:N-acetyltransferase 10
MLFGESQDYPTACRLMDACMAAGVNFFDSAEMYPVPQRAETQGKSEEYLGRWMKQHSRCDAMASWPSSSCNGAE